MEKEKLLLYLKEECLGEENARHSKVLEVKLGIKGKSLRKMVNSLRKDAVPIASSDSGYFYAETDEEIEATIRHMERRIRGISGAILGLKRALSERDSLQERLPLEGGSVNG